ncbi:uncharacterized protein F4812DRAFT_428553 [Daldinia caldariorum]|uniref:uncharacterized protein n=1 Tax=Daldinia caldariorum TaxID=326644 RepID=UPI0020089368|nr:uncharacterized protein F4812DRAFT_428553 [Daldinia caldariorum]KAI1468030.1 hypothetical protein F4812DRAFT_428553 [Daldinia caldariorum]
MMASWGKEQPLPKEEPATEDWPDGPNLWPWYLFPIAFLCYSSLIALPWTAFVIVLALLFGWSIPNLTNLFILTLGGLTFVLALTGCVGELGTTMIRNCGIDSLQKTPPENGLYVVLYYSIAAEIPRRLSPPRLMEFPSNFGEHKVAFRPQQLPGYGRKPLFQDLV